MKLKMILMLIMSLMLVCSCGKMMSGQKRETVKEVQADPVPEETEDQALSGKMPQTSSGIGPDTAGGRSETPVVETGSAARETAGEETAAEKMKPSAASAERTADLCGELFTEVSGEPDPEATLEAHTGPDTEIVQTETVQPAAAPVPSEPSREAPDRSLEESKTVPAAEPGTEHAAVTPEERPAETAKETETSSETPEETPARTETDMAVGTPAEAPVRTEAETSAEIQTKVLPRTEAETVPEASEEIASQTLPAETAAETSLEVLPERSSEAAAPETETATGTGTAEVRKIYLDRDISVFVDYVNSYAAELGFTVIPNLQELSGCFDADLAVVAGSEEAALKRIRSQLEWYKRTSFESGDITCIWAVAQSHQFGATSGKETWYIRIYYG